MTGANLTRANLTGANLTGANLAGAILDYSSWPLCCGSKGVIVDRRIAVQLLAHFCAVVCEDEDVKQMQADAIALAKTFHHPELLIRT